MPSIELELRVRWADSDPAITGADVRLVKSASEGWVTD
jgi:hypothetical protein